MDIPFVLLPVDLLVSLQSQSDPAFNRKLYLAVKQSVQEHLVNSFKLDFKAQGLKAVDLIEKYFSNSGWGNIEIVQANSRAIVHVFNNPFAFRLFGVAKEPCDHIFRGIFAGLFSMAFQKEIDCVELHCIAQGANDCEFILKQQHDFDVSKKEVQNQLELET
jgi:predicted hydrocarbon binding protein